MGDSLSPAVTVIAIAVAVQTLLLLGIAIGAAVGAKKLSARMKTIGDEMESRVLPLLDSTKATLQEVKATLETTRPKMDVILENVANVSTTARADVERVHATVQDMLDRARLQVIRADEMMTRTMDRVEEASDKVQRSVMAPVRQASGIMQAISTGVGTFFSSQRRPRNGGPSDEMFI